MTMLLKSFVGLLDSMLHNKVNRLSKYSTSMCCGR